MFNWTCMLCFCWVNDDDDGANLFYISNRYEAVYWEHAGIPNTLKFQMEFRIMQQVLNIQMHNMPKLLDDLIHFFYQRINNVSSKYLPYVFMQNW